MSCVEDFIEEVNQVSIAKQIHSKFKDKGEFKLPDVYPLFENKKETVRARIYTNLGIMFEKVSRGVYKCSSDNGSKSLIIEGDGKDLSMVPDESIDAIITDHPWEDHKNLKGGSRNFINGFNNKCFSYNEKDFTEKARVLKDGHFLVEMLPEISGTNWPYLFEIMKMAERAGFKFYTQVAWKKGKTSINMGRKKRNKEMLYFFTKGEARRMRRCNRATIDKMSGTRSLLPAEYDFNPIPPKKRDHPVEKPLELMMNIIHQVTEVGEIVLDQFSGSFKTMFAALATGRHSISIELQKEYVKKVVNSGKKV